MKKVGLGVIFASIFSLHATDSHAASVTVSEVPTNWSLMELGGVPQIWGMGTPCFFGRAIFDSAYTEESINRVYSMILMAKQTSSIINVTYDDGADCKITNVWFT